VFDKTCSTAMQSTIGKSKELSPSLDEALATYRHKIFIERIGWPLPVEHSMERNQFDHPETLYVMTREPSGTICGCARLLPTTEPHLLSEVFSHLLAGVSVPHSRDVRELSRFTAATTAPNPSVDAMVNTRCLLAEAVKTASEYGAK
jgi:acyl homoserine lactone synthase